MKCTVAISADDDKELIEAAVQHAVAVHGEHDTPEFRKEIRNLIHEGTPPLAVA
jgi:predicted small metal-binding protein